MKRVDRSSAEIRHPSFIQNPGIGAESGLKGNRYFKQRGLSISGHGLFVPGYGSLCLCSREDLFEHQHLSIPHNPLG